MNKITVRPWIFSRQNSTDITQSVSVSLIPYNSKVFIIRNVFLLILNQMEFRLVQIGETVQAHYLPLGFFCLGSQTGQFRDPLPPLYTIECCDVRGISGGP